jgi:hemerythrin-like metal-binding protein
MPLVEWEEKFKLGIASVDYEHEELIALINELHAGLESDPPREAVADFLGEIHARISAHFALEEKLMREQRYDAYDAHKSDHEALREEIREIMDGYEAGAYDDPGDTLSESLRAWFTNHFETHDARLHRRLGDHYPGIEEI